MDKYTDPLWFRLLAKDRTLILTCLLMFITNLPTQDKWKSITCIIIALLQVANLNILYLLEEY